MNAGGIDMEYDRSGLPCAGSGLTWLVLLLLVFLLLQNGGLTDTPC